MIKRIATCLVAVTIVAILLVNYAPQGTLDHWLGWIQNAVAAQQRCVGSVLRVIDGDTVWMRCNGAKVKVRLDYIDAPEVAHPYWHKPGQPGGQQAKSMLIALIGGQPVTLAASGKDDYGRTLGALSVNGMNLNLAMVRKGWAWAYRGYTTSRYIKAQKMAKTARRGLWSFPPDQRIPPWQFRHRHD